MPLPYRNRSYFAATNPELVEAFDDIASHLEAVMNQTNSAPVGSETVAPPKINKLTMTASQGIFEAKIDDNNSDIVRGVNYFLDYSDNPAFNNKRTIALGPSRNWRGTLGNRKLYFQAYSQHPNTPMSPPVFHTTTGLHPTMVEGGGSATGPEFQSSSGSGTSQSGNASDGGYGSQPFRGVSRPTTWQQKK